jgi:hypothetical protein
MNEPFDPRFPHIPGRTDPCYLRWCETGHCNHVFSEWINTPWDDYKQRQCEVCGTIESVDLIHAG